MGFLAACYTAFLFGQCEGRDLWQTPLLPAHLIAQARGIPERFLLKVLKPLVSARVLHSVKGPNGGYRLARPAKDISMLEIIEAVDGPIRGQAPLSEVEGDGHLDRKLERMLTMLLRLKDLRRPRRPAHLS